MSLPFAATFNYQRQATINYFINVYNPTIINLIATTHPDPFIIRRHKIYAFILFALLAFLQIQNTGSTPSPFHDHPVTTQACFLAIFCYFLAFMASLRLPQYSSQLSTAMAAFGSFSSATLVHSEICLENEEIVAAKFPKATTTLATEIHGSDE
ncbi:hypothetical protein HN51_005607 [Arachis hypogaea]|uniref:Uncharacterized protein LOC107485518 n=1 Tax=Arachis duranensis TaxID=130453 RepID=A0A6P4D9T5_ARADU|nr:uncharacterized protein LOC107485518 [Arachis duranensis]XP_025695949.1 uncharacterized protein LOC112797310 [Arachis hypogaea]QHO39383.1 uncharacterized protein DS421_4g128670 [Arachis hypogaea]